MNERAPQQQVSVPGAWIETGEWVSAVEAERQSGRMASTVFDALKWFMNRARYLGRAHVAMLREETIAAGFSADVVDDAIKFWAEYEQREGVPAG